MTQGQPVYPTHSKIQGAWNIAAAIAMFPVEHFVAGPAPCPWNRPFPKPVCRTGLKIPETDLFQPGNRSVAISTSRFQLLYTCMTLPPGTCASNPVGWFTHEPGFTDELPHKGFHLVLAFTTLDRE